MAKPGDFTDEAVEEFVTEQVKTGNAERERLGLPHEPTPAELEAARAGDEHRADRAVGADGRVSSEYAPESPASPTGTPAGVETPGADRGRGSRPGVVPATAPTRPDAETVRRNIKAPIMDAKELKVKAKGFLSPDVENNLWSTLDKKVEAALQGSTPEETAQNMATAAWTFLFELLGNWADVHRKEAKRVKKENEERLANYDHNMGVEPIHKNLAVWAVIADHPAIRELVGNGPLDKAARKKVAKFVKKNPKALNALGNIVQSMARRTFDRAELNKIVINGLNMDLSGATLDDVKNAALDDPVILNAAAHSGIESLAAEAHRRKASHEEDAETQRLAREVIRLAREGARSESGERSGRPTGRETPAPTR